MPGTTSVVALLLYKTVPIVIVTAVITYLVIRFCEIAAFCWTTICTLRRANCPNLTWKCLTYPGVWRMFNNKQLWMKVMYDITEGVPVGVMLYKMKAFILTHDADYVRVMLHHPSMLQKSEMYDGLTNVIGQSVLVAPVKRWKMIRKLLMPIFSLKVMGSFEPVVHRHAVAFAKEIGQQKGVFDIRPFLCRTIFKVVNETLFGMTDTDEKIVDLAFTLMDRIMNIAFLRIIRLFHLPRFLYDLSDEAKTMKRDMETIRVLTLGEISKRKKFVEEERKKRPEEQSGTVERVIIDIMANEETNAQYNITEQDIVDELTSIRVAAGHSSIATLQAIFLLLANNPDVQGKLYDELYGIYGFTDPAEFPVCMSDFGRLNYMDRVIKEALRLFPPVTFMGRKSDEDIEVSGGKIIPKGCSLLVSVLQLHRSEKYWKDPLKFDPDRFLPENFTNVHPGAYIPFSLGPRNCPGYIFAMVTVKFFLATVMRQYEVITENPVEIDKVEVDVNVLSWIADPIRIRLRRRN